VQGCCRFTPFSLSGVAKEPFSTSPFPARKEYAPGLHAPTKIEKPGGKRGMLRLEASSIFWYWLIGETAANTVTAFLPRTGEN